jgi:hypothetical protein
MKNAEVSLSIRSCSVGINLKGDKRLIYAAITSPVYRKIITSPKLDKPCSKYPTLVVRKSRKFRLVEGYPLAKYWGNSPEDVITIAKHMLERIKQEHGIYTIHGSAVSKNDEGVVLFGWKNTGKTSTAIYLVKNKGFEFVSDGQMSINEKGEIIGRITEFEDLYNKLKKLYKIENINNLKIESEDKKPKISLLVYPQIAPTNEVINWGNSPTSIFHLYEQLSIEIRGLYASYINNFSRPLCSLDTVNLAIRRIAFVKRLLKQTKVLQIRGSVKFIAEEIIKNL